MHLMKATFITNHNHSLKCVTSNILQCNLKDTSDVIKYFKGIFPPFLPETFGMFLHKSVAEYIK